MDYVIKSTKKELSERKKESWRKYAIIRQWGLKYPTRFVERFYGIELLDIQKYIFMNTWIASRSVWNVCRNGGKTTLVAPLCMAKCNLISNYQIYIMAGVGSQAQGAFMKMEAIAKKEIASFTGLTDFFIGELYYSPITNDPFLHNPNSFSTKFYNGSRINTLNGDSKNIRSKRSNYNVYDEAGWTEDALFDASMPFINQNSDFILGGNKDITLIPKKFKNGALLVSSASDTGTTFYKSYKQYAKNMLLGNSDYFVADANIEVFFNATYNGKVYPSLISKQEVEDQIKKNKMIADREYYNQFSIDGGDRQPFKRITIKKNSFVRVPQIIGDGKKKYVLVYDPSNKRDNPIVMVAEIIHDPDLGYKMEICNCVCLRDWATKNKVPLRSPEQIDYIRNMISEYNGFKKTVADYENIDAIIIDAGAGGGGASIATYLMDDWVDKSGKKHRGFIDAEYSSEHYSKFKNASKNLIMLNPQHKYKMFDSLLSMLELGLITFTESYDNKGYLMLSDDSETYEDVDEKGNKIKSINRKFVKYDLSMKEQMALMEIDLAKEELANMYKYLKGDNRYTYDLAPEYRDSFDDRAFCLAMLGWHLENKRMQNIIEKPKQNKPLLFKPKRPSAYGRKIKGKLFV